MMIPTHRKLVLVPLVCVTAFVAVVAPAAGADGSPPGGTPIQLDGTSACIAQGGPQQCAPGVGLDQVFDLSIAPSGDDLYAASGAAGDITALSREPGVGALSQPSGTAACVADGGSDPACGAGRGLTFAYNSVVSPDGKNVYVASHGSNSIAAFSRDPASGRLTQLSGDRACVASDASVGCTAGRGLKGASDVAISPDGKTVYVAADGASPQADGSVAVFSRDPASGALRQLSGVAGCVSETGDNGDCADDRALDGATRVVVSGDGRYVYVASLFSDGIAVLSRDATTGELTQLSDSSGCITDIGAVSDCAIGHHLDYPHALAVSPDDKYVYVASVDSDAITTFARDDSTGALTQVSGAAGCIADGDGGGGCGPARALRGPLALAISPDGRRLYAASYYSHAIVAFARDAVTGGLTQLAGSDGCVARAVEGCAPGTGLTEVSALAITPDETNLYAASPSDSAISSFSLAGWSTPSCTAIDAPVAHDTATLVHLSCSEPDGDSLALSVATPPAHGTLSPIDNDTDTVTYTPTPGYAGTDDFSFRARDPDGWSDVAKATLHVSAAPPPPPEAVSKVWTEALARLASKRRCVASAPLRSQLTQPHQARIDAATLQINLRAAVVRRGSGVTHPVTFHRVPRGRFALRITLSLHDGRHLRTTRWYPACKTWANR